MAQIQSKHFINITIMNMISLTMWAKINYTIKSRLREKNEMKFALG